MGLILKWLTKQTNRCWSSRPDPTAVFDINKATIPEHRCTPTYPKRCHTVGVCHVDEGSTCASACGNLHCQTSQQTSGVMMTSLQGVRMPLGSCTMHRAVERGRIGHLLIAKTSAASHPFCKSVSTKHVQADILRRCAALYAIRHTVWRELHLISLLEWEKSADFCIYLHNRLSC
jgi:hypothetical protein